MFHPQATNRPNGLKMAFEPSWDPARLVLAGVGWVVITRGSRVLAAAEVLIN